ncbi:MAG: RluA family pseudouridine synthase [Pseudomonadota bacterium]
MVEKYLVVIESENSGNRLDKALANLLPEFSRSRIKQLLDEGSITSSGVVIKDASYKVKIGEEYVINVAPAQTSHISASEIALDIIFEDEHILVINKPSGMTVHPAPGHQDDTLVNALLAHCGDTLSGIGGVIRPGIVHRIDKDTSGLLVVAKNDVAHRHLANQIEERTLKREYIAFVKGTPKPLSGKIEANIARSNVNRQKMAVVKMGGKTAITHYHTQEVFKDSSFIRCKLETGRTHQIRVHLCHIGYPIIGDKVYGRKDKNYDFPRQALHAEKLTLIHPVIEKIMEFNAPLPSDMLELLEIMRSKS